MKPGDEVVSPATDDPTPLARLPASAPGERTPSAPVPQPPGEAAPPARPTAEQVLRWIAAAADGPWFPSAHAKQTGTPRDSLDEPLNELRLAGLVRVATWVRGAGQGYALTPEGETAARDPAGLAVVRDLIAPAGDGPDEQPAEPDPAAPPGPSVIDLRPPVVTPALLLANLIWFFVGLVVASRLGVPVGAYLWEGNREVLTRLGAVSAPDLLRGEWWRLATSCFVHGNGLHLLGNLLLLGMLGPTAELLWGRWRALAVYALAGLGGSCLAMALRPVDPETGVAGALVGASGAIWGLLTSLVAWLLLFHPYLPRDLVADWSRRLGLGFALNAGLSLLPGVSWESHLGGGVVGFVAAGLLNTLRFGDRTQRVSAAVLLAALPALCVGGLVAATESGDGWVLLRHRLAAREAAARRHAAAESAREQAVDAVRHAAEAVAPKYHLARQLAQAFDPEVARLLDAIKPAAVQPVEREAVVLLGRDPDRRSAGGVREKVEQVRAAAAKAADRLSVPPTGVEAVDRLRARARAFASAQAKSYELLLRMLDANAIPDPAAWKAWGDARREAERLWAELNQPAARP